MEDKYIKWLSILIFVCGGLILIANYAKDHYTKIKEEKEKEAENRKTATSGKLLSPEGETKNTSNTATRNSEIITLKIGGVSCDFEKVQFEKGIQTPTCLTIDNTIPVIIKLIDNKPIISTEIYDIDGKLVCEINDNKWSINKNNFYKRNYDDYAIEVVDQYNNVVLSVEFKNNSTVIVNGIFNSIGKGFAFAYHDSLTFLEYYPQAKKMIEQIEGRSWDEIYLEHAKKIPHLFSYDNDDYIGDRIK